MKQETKKCACGMSMASYPWTKMCKLCYQGRRKCSCGHLVKDHYISDAEVSKGKVFCGKDNCTGWNMCDLSPQVVKNVQINNQKND